MFFSKDKEDDDEFIPNPNSQSHLSALFGNNVNDRNSSLVYSAPKQPKPPKAGDKPTSSVAPTTGASSTRVIIVKQVQAFRLVEGAYQNNGRVAAALYMYAGKKPVYQILLNKDRRNYLCNMRVTREFNYHVQPKNYVTFYMDKTVWSILFESPSEVTEFSLQVALVRWKSGDNTNVMFHQDLWCPAVDKPVVAAVGDTVEILYGLRTLDDCYQDCEDGGGSQRVCVTVESTGWTQALVDARPTMKRVLFLQHDMLGDLNPAKTRYESPVVVRLTVLQVTKAPPAPPPPQALPDNIIGDLNSLPRLPSSSAVYSPQPRRADLITRMARMGQPLPFKTAASAPSDSDDTEEDMSCKLKRGSGARARSLDHMTMATPPPPAPVPTPTVTVPVPVQWAPTSYMGGGGMYGPAGGGSGEGAAQFNMFLSEVRTTNSELRMGMTRLTDKVEALQNKLGDSERKSDGKDIAAIMERLLDNETQLKSELESVKSALCSLQLTSVQPPPAAPATCQRCAALDTLTETLKKLEDENDYLKNSLSAHKEAIQNAKMADRDQLVQIVSLSQEVEAGRSTSSGLNQRILEYQREMEAAHKTITELQATVADQQRQVDRLEQCLQDSEAVKVGEVRDLIGQGLSPAVGEHIKAIFNIASRFIKSQFQPDSVYDVKYINRVFSETVRGVALEYLEHGGNVSASDTDIFTKQEVSEEERTTRTATEASCSGAHTESAEDIHNGESDTVETKTSCPVLETAVPQKDEDDDTEATDTEVSQTLQPAVEQKGPDDNTEATHTEVDHILSKKLQTLLLHLSRSQTRLFPPFSQFPLPSPPPTPTINHLPSCFFHQN